VVAASCPFVVYVVDDDPSVREGLSLLMRSAGYRVRACDSGEELLAMGGATLPGCVLLDLSAVRRSDRPLDKRLREKGLDLPVIALSALGEREADDRARAAGASFLLSKPVDDRALLDAIRWVSGGTQAAPRSP